ncbi:MAG TPA: hypothetical protein VND24_08080, partial [Steroidobacteraceae bacterium]|nr:hypothetical protein [Steroidobacteraceae bacterium]
VSRERPYFLAPELERVLAIAMTLAQELAVARSRIDTLERVLERKGLVGRSEIEAFEPTSLDQTERSRESAEYVERILRVLGEDLERMRAVAESPGSGADQG